ncbi:hypothetical protein FA15DRAFT_695539 [Coprinopsis marcescibilis]|uniref:GST N-terminal domain-containing protein n=1 Tax=Coprinopsis marcescibilis TaxID=230819 RepID=A0A5C3KQM5_COPMA|nr:hypothetical protein FA15DRAFT_695539 [Coprinopsis marcescibilis]
MITFYDINDNIQSPVSHSPYCWRTRICLNYKQIAYRTEWVRYNDITAFAKEKGIPPTAVHSDGSPRYTLPAIYDSDNDSYVSDSFKIAQYLDKKYPDTPRLVPENTTALHAAWEAMYNPIHGKLAPLLEVAVIAALDPVSAERDKKQAEASFKMSWQEIVKAAEPDQEGWKDVEKAVALWLNFLDNRNATDGEGIWVMGSQLSFADAVIGGVFLTTKVLWGENSGQWKEVKNWSGGKWADYIGSLEKYSAAL